MLSAVYPVTPEIIEWLNNNLMPLEESVFKHYRGIQHLVRLVDRVESGHAPKYAALSALRDYNEEKSTNITYGEVKNRCPTYIFTDIGEWSAYVDDDLAVRKILAGDEDDARDALANAPADIYWIVLWLPSDDVIVVHRSPHTGKREYYDVELGLAAGQNRGPFDSHTLPPSIEAAMGTTDPDEILYHRPQWSRTNAR